MSYQLPPTPGSQTSEKGFHLPLPDYPQALNLPIWLLVAIRTGSFHLMGNSQNRTAVFTQNN